MHANIRTLFRCLVVAHFALGVICYVASASASGSWRTFSDPAKAVMEIIFWALDVAAAVGLFLFRSWARWLFITLIVLFFVAALLLRPGSIAFASPFGVLGLIEWMLAGMIITMSLFPSVTEAFNRKT